MGSGDAILHEAVEDIRSMRVRGAAAIATSAAKALAAYVGACTGDLEAVREAARNGAKALASSRPTAVSLRHGLAPVVAAVASGGSAPDAKAAATAAARAFAQE